jgi:hypothetical protein
LEQRRQAVGLGGCAPTSGGTSSGDGGGVGRASGELGDNGVDSCNDRAIFESLELNTAHVFGHFDDRSNWM